MAAETAGRDAVAVTIAMCLVLGLADVLSMRVEASPQGSPAADTRTVWGGAYTDCQAERGSATYLRSCAKCHGADLLGDSGAERPALVGDAFMDRWDRETVAAIFARIKTAMPGDAPGTLSSNEYADLVAYLLRTNGFPAGGSELQPDVDVLARVVVNRR